MEGAFILYFELYQLNARGHFFKQTTPPAFKPAGLICFNTTAGHFAESLSDNNILKPRSSVLQYNRTEDCRGTAACRKGSIEPTFNGDHTRIIHLK